MIRVCKDIHGSFAVSFVLLQKLDRLNELGFEIFQFPLSGCNNSLVQGICLIHVDSLSTIIGSFKLLTDAFYVGTELLSQIATKAFAFFHIGNRALDKGFYNFMGILLFCSGPFTTAKAGIVAEEIGHGDYGLENE